MQKSKTTKELIIEAAIDLFNEQGYSNTTTRQIAEKMKISRGNLSYHFKGKGEILSEVYEKILKDRLDISFMPKHEFSIKYLKKLFIELILLQKKYRFFFIDLIEILREHEQIKTKFIKTTNSHMIQGRALIDYYVGSGVMIQEPYPKCYDLLSESIWMVRAFWHSRHWLRGDSGGNEEEQALRTILSLFYPYLTEPSKIEWHLLFDDP